MEGGQVRIDGERSVVCCRYFFNSGRSELLMIPVVEMHGGRPLTAHRTRWCRTICSR
ncbi:hypothetical protein [Thermogymnomonas acidicola]|uniref:hypothetical protein n=1 Tax=Thermogymnomonas acidicola TaxID=399579 RepID=UPI0014950594|nr:hypothetical protein [Thermogymnomonas acidicola]